MLHLLCEVKSRKASYVRPRSQFLVGMVMAPTYILLCLGSIRPPHKEYIYILNVF